VTVTPATSTTGVFTATSVAPAAAGCTVTITGATGTTAVAVTSTVPAPGGVILRWYTPNYVTQSPPVPVTSGPINLIGLGALFASVLQISEQNYIGGFAPANVKTSAGCAGVPPFATIAANGTVPTGLPRPPPDVGDLLHRHGRCGSQYDRRLHDQRDRLIHDALHREHRRLHNDRLGVFQ